jgi:hypothetical protein
MGRNKILNKNQRVTRPVKSMRIDRELSATFQAICIESGNIEFSTAIERILRYLIKPTSIETTKAIIQAEE